MLMSTAINMHDRDLPKAFLSHKHVQCVYALSDGERIAQSTIEIGLSLVKQNFSSDKQRIISLCRRCLLDQMSQHFCVFFASFWRTVGWFSLKFNKNVSFLANQILAQLIVNSNACLALLFVK